MILTVTLNPSLDRTIEIDRLERGGVIRARATQLHPGGKGVNVTRALLGNAVPSLAVLPAGGHEGRRLLALLDAEGVAHRTVVVAGETRSNTTVAEADGTTTKLNEPGAPLLAEELSAIAELVVAAAVPGRWVVLCGSLPPGVPTDQYARTTERLQAAGMRVAVDTSGAPLAAALEAGPDLVTPNAAELGETVGQHVGAAATVHEQGHGATLTGATDGPARCCPALPDQRTRVGVPPVSRTRSANDSAITVSGVPPAAQTSSNCSRSRSTRARSRPG